MTLVPDPQTCSWAQACSSMNHAKDKSPSPLPAVVVNEDLVVSSQKRAGLVNSHIVHIHADPILCNSVASTSFCKTHPNHSEKHGIQVSPNVTPHMVDGNSMCRDESSTTEVCMWEKSAAGSDSEEDRPGSFDYMPKQKGHVRVVPAINPSYDEEVKLDSSTASSLVESPRSDDDGHAEEENLAVTELVKKTRSRHKHTCWHYTTHHSQKSDNDDEEEEEDDTNDDDEDVEDEENRRLDGASSGSSALSSFPRTPAAKEVDEAVSYNLKPLNGPSAGQQKGPDAGQSHQLDLPLPYSLYQDRWMSDDSKEKDKKRGRSKDDTDKPEATGPVDINGNPRLLDPAIYPQMRQWPGSKLSSTASGSLSSLTPLTISHSHAPSGADANAFDRKKERRRMKLERLKGTPAEEIQGHRKFSDIKEILAFVEGTNNSKGENKSGKKKHERSRKKDHPDGPHLLEDTVGVDDASSKEESLVVTSVQAVARAMGNSFRRSFDESIPKSLSEDEDVDKSNAEFHDCLNTLPAESAAANNGNNDDSQQKLNGSVLSGDKTSSPTDADQSAFSADDSKTDKHLTDSAGKKSSKSKTKKEKPESVGGDNGHLISKLGAGKRKDSLERRNSLLVSSVLCAENVKSDTANMKDPHLEMKREDSFTEVKKKKKRPGVKDVHTIFPGHFSKSYNNSHSSSGMANHKFQHRTSTPSPQPPVILPGCSQIVALPVGSQTQPLRDLSPSAFPVLSGQGQPAGLRPEARRNSCGDLNSDSLDNRTYDSDRESAKSLPAAHGAVTSGDILPAHPLSYARIAAAPRKNDYTGNPSLDSSVASIPPNTSIPQPPVSSGIPQSSSDPAVTPERKTTIWKGSPRERRHSIGSSPKDKVEDGEKTSVAEKNRQCGSQEVLSKSTVSSASKAAKRAAVSASVIRQTHENSSSSHHIHTNNAQTEAVPTVETVAAGCTVTCTPMDAKSIPQTGKTDIAAPNARSPEYAVSSSLCKIPDSAKELHPVISFQSVQASEVCKNVDTELITRKSTHETSVTVFSSQSHTVPSAETCSENAVNNKIRQNCHTDAVRRNPKKSVIFLDKRFESAPPQNLGITFGFDSSYESASQLTSHRQPQPPFPPPHHQSPPPPAAVTSAPSGFPSSSLPPPPPPASPVSAGQPHIPPAPHPAAAAVASSTNTLQFTSGPPPPPPPSAQSSDHSKPVVPKGPHIRGPCNGLVFPSRAAKRTPDEPSQIIRDSNTSGVRSGCSVSYQEIISVGRTSSCSGETDTILVTSGTRNKVPSGESPAADQQNRSLPPAATAGEPATCAGPNSSGKTTPPPHTDPAETARENSGLSLPSRQERACQRNGDPVLTELGPGESGVGPSAAAREAADMSPSSAAAAAAAETDSQQQKQDVSDSQPASLRPVPVVYGLKIKSGTGCGQLLFVPSWVSKKNRGNSEELVGFLRKRWLEVTQEPGAETFITLSYNEGSL